MTRSGTHKNKKVRNHPVQYLDGAVTMEETVIMVLGVGRMVRVLRAKRRLTGSNYTVLEHGWQKHVYQTLSHTDGLDKWPGWSKDLEEHL